MHVTSVRALVGLCISVGLATSGCTAGGDDSVSAKVELIDRTSSASSLSVVDHLESINGVYGSCRDRAGQPWSVAVTGTPQLAHPALSVVTNDASCTLTLTEVVVDGATLAAAPSLSLATSFATAASAFRTTTNAPAAFFGNAKIDTATFASDFTIRLVVSDPGRDDWDHVTGAYTTESSTVDASGVAPPDYAIDMTGLMLQTDANQLFTNASGYGQLTARATEAQTFAIHNGHLASWETLEGIGAAWDAASVKGDVADLELLRLSAAQFDVVGSQYHAVRTVILRNTQEGVTSYQLIKIFFHGSDI